MATISPPGIITVADLLPEPEALEVMDAGQKKWSLTKEGFDRLLDCFHSDRETAGRQYEVIRSKLIHYFDWRDCPFPEEHADEAINRVIRKLDAGETFRDLSTYVFGIARMIVLEIGRAKEKERASLDLLTQPQPVAAEPEDQEERVDCLKRCLASLSERSRELITGYYQGDGATKIKQRKELAARWGLQLNALRIRACRVRAKLEACMERCLTAGHKNEIVTDFPAGNE